MQKGLIITDFKRDTSPFVNWNICVFHHLMFCSLIVISVEEFPCLFCFRDNRSFCFLLLFRLKNIRNFAVTATIAFFSYCYIVNKEFGCFSCYLDYHIIRFLVVILAEEFVGFFCYRYHRIFWFVCFIIVI